MRRFTLVVSAIFTAEGIWMIASGESFGWLLAGFFGLCLVVAVLEPRLPKPWLVPEYRVVIASGEVACEHPKRPREAIRWEDVNRVWHVTTSDGPWSPDRWILLEGKDRGCSFPTEASGFDLIWDELKERFPGFDYKPFLEDGAAGAKRLCWERQKRTT